MKLSLKEFFLHEAGELPPGDEPLEKKGDIAGLPAGDEPLGEHQDPTCTPDAGATIWSDPTQPADVRKFKNVKGNLHVDIKEMFGTSGIDEMGGEGSGRKPGSKNKPRPSAITPGTPADPSQLPDELPDDFGVDIDTSDFDDPGNIDQSDITGAGAPQHQPDQPVDPSGFEPPEDEPFARSAGDLGDEGDLSWLDDPALGQGVEVPKYDPDAPKPAKPPPMAKADYEGPWQASPEHQEFLDTLGSFEPDEPKDKGQFWRDIEDEDGDAMSWDELKDAEPDIASDIEAEYPDIADPGTFAGEPGGVQRERDTLFTVNKAGDIIMRSKGERFKWDPETAGWIPMDDGETPSGEF